MRGGPVESKENKLHYKEGDLLEVWREACDPWKEILEGPPKVLSPKQFFVFFTLNSDHQILLIRIMFQDLFPASPLVDKDLALCSRVESQRAAAAAESPWDHLAAILINKSACSSRAPSAGQYLQLRRKDRDWVLPFGEGLGELSEFLKLSTLLERAASACQAQGGRLCLQYDLQNGIVLSWHRRRPLRTEEELLVPPVTPTLLWGW